MTTFIVYSKLSKKDGIKMTTFIVYSKLSKKDGKKMYNGVKKWFEDHPRRKVCNTDLGKVRRAHIKDDVSRFCVRGALK